MSGADSSNQGRAPAVAQRSGRTTLVSNATPEQLIATLDAASRDPDIYCVVNERPSGTGAAQAIWRIDRFGKPFVSLLEGAMPWETFASVVNGTHKVGDPGMAVSFSNPAPDQVPALGASFHLPALPHRLGLYLALTGSSLDSGLAYQVGWLTHRVPGSQFGRIKAALATAEPVDAVLDELDLGAGTSPLEPRLATIERCFSAEAPAAIIARLEATVGADADWARQCASAMRAMPGRSLEAAYRLLTAQAQSSLRQALVAEAARWPGQPAGDLNFPDPAPPSIS